MAGQNGEVLLLQQGGRYHVVWIFLVSSHLTTPVTVFVLIQLCCCLIVMFIVTNFGDAKRTIKVWLLSGFIVTFFTHTYTRNWGLTMQMQTYKNWSIFPPAPTLPPISLHAMKVTRMHFFGREAIHGLNTPSLREARWMSCWHVNFCRKSWFAWLATNPFGMVPCTLRN